jgi:hypothetical protein
LDRFSDMAILSREERGEGGGNLSVVQSAGLGLACVFHEA